MKILIVSNLFPPFYVGGFEIRCEQVSRALAARGHEVAVLTSHHGAKGSKVEDNGITVHRVLDLYHPFANEGSKETLPFELGRLSRWMTTRRNYRKALKFLRTERPDLVFAWSQSRLSLGAARAAHDLYIPLAWTFGDANIAQYRPAPFRKNVSKLRAFLFDTFIAPHTTWQGLNFAYVHCVSEFTKARLISGGLPATHARVIYRGIPLQKFPPKEPLGELHSPVRILYVGQVQRSKGVHTVIEAAQRLNADSAKPVVAVTIVGEGDNDYKEELRTLAASGSTPVEFLGKVAHDEISNFYREHDLFVFPSTARSREGFGATALEAMASGLPVLGTSQGGMAELFVDEENALIFPAEQSDVLAKKLNRLIHDDALRKRIARHARDRIEVEFNLDRYIDDIERFVIDAAAQFKPSVTNSTAVSDSLGDLRKSSQK